MGLRDKLVTDAAMEEGGNWFDVLDTGVSFLCRRFHAGNKAAARAYREEMGKLQAKIDAEVVEPEELRAAMARVWARHIVLDWEGVTAYDLDPEAAEEPVPFSSEACEKLFAAIPDVLEVITVESSKRENYLASLRKRQAGN